MVKRRQRALTCFFWVYRGIVWHIQLEFCKHWCFGAWQCTCLGGVESEISKALFKDCVILSEEYFISIITEYLSIRLEPYTSEGRITPHDRALQIPRLAHLAAGGWTTRRFAAIKDGLDRNRTQWDVITTYALTSAHLGLASYAVIAVPGPSAPIPDKPTSLHVLFHQVLQRVERRQSVLGSVAALALSGVPPGRDAGHRRAADGVKRATLAVLDAEAVARARADVAGSEVRRDGAVEVRGHQHGYQGPHHGQAGADDRHVGFERHP